MYLIPDKVDVIPVSPLTEGFDTQRLCINFHEYPGTRSNRKITYLFSHANGLCKECFHPIMRRLVDYLRTLPEYNQTDITFVSWDGRNQGDSALLNHGTLSSTYSWVDHSLDMKQVIDYYNLKEDQLIGIGHSYSATCMIMLEFQFPKTFDGMCLFEPGLAPTFTPMEVFLTLPYLTSSNNRRDVWPNRQACSKQLMGKGVFELFHPETFDLYVNYGTYVDDDGEVRLKCPKEEEMHIFFTCHKPVYSAIKMLEHLTIPTHIVKAVDSHAPPIDLDALIKLNRHVTKSSIEGTHMAPNENPDSTIPVIKFITERIEISEEALDSKL